MTVEPCKVFSMPAKEENGKVWMDGTLVDFAQANVSIMTHALHYGTGVFEGIRCYKTSKGPAIFRLDEHLARLERGSKFYWMELPFSRAELAEATKETVRANRHIDEPYLRPLVYRGAGPIGVNPMSAPVRVAIIAVNMGKYFDPKTAELGIKCEFSNWLRISKDTIPPHVKACGQYINSVLAKVEAVQNGYHEAIMLNNRGRVAEGSGENIFMAKGGEISTPLVSEDILEGITRESVMEIARDLGLKVFERTLEKDDLLSADEVFMTGTAAEVTPVTNIGGRTLSGGRRGPITEKLQEKFFQAARGMDEKYAKWLTFV